MGYYAAFQQTCEELRRLGYRVIVTGDLNTAHQPRDVHDPVRMARSTGFLPRERAWLDAMLCIDEAAVVEVDGVPTPAGGFIDTYRAMHPDATGAYTFWDMKTGREKERIVSSIGQA